jgi:GTPase
MFKGQKSSKTEQGLLNSENLPPEVEIGNVEYKEKLINQSASRLEHLTSQMKWRLDEGGGEALYEIGVSDNGRLIGISLQEMDMSLNTLNLIARNLKATTRLLHTLKIQDRLVCEVLILAIRSLDLSEISLCVLGNTAAGSIKI